VLKQTISLAVNASKIAADESTSGNIPQPTGAGALEEAWCSIKCETPFCSHTLPARTARHPDPTETERTCGIASVMTLIPLGQVV